jgi:hypothetical protein
MRHFKKNCQLQGLESIFQTIRTGEFMNRWRGLLDSSAWAKIYLKGSHLRRELGSQLTACEINCDWKVETNDLGWQ